MKGFFLEKLVVRGIRNIHLAEIQLCPGFNLFYGLNGSGKSSILEAVYILSRGRSFRTRNLKTVITHGQPECTCFGVIRDEARNASVPIGVSRHGSGAFFFKVDGEYVQTASRLAEVMPVQLINSESYQLLNGAPGERRSYLDWGVFHVEHSYRLSLTRFQRCLKHRNSLLRRGKIDPLELSVWDKEFCILSQQITSARERYLEALVPVTHEVFAHLGLVGDYGFRFVPGWDTQTSLQEQLEGALERDQKVGFTQVGPHRADIRITAGQSLAADVLSRGQGKMLVYALKLAQGLLLKRLARRQCIYMLDDLPAELDGKHRANIGKLLSEMGVQVLITGVDRQDLQDIVRAEDTPLSVFHVEQGAVRPDSLGM